MRNKWVIWPVYFDAEVGREKGRKIPKELAVKHPTIDEIYRAAKKLGLNPVREEKAHPKRWWRKEGRILVDKKGRKTEIIRKIAKIIKQSRISSNTR